MICERCGRCCTYADKAKILPELTFADLARLTPLEHATYVEIIGCRYGIRALAGHNGSVCSALGRTQDGTWTCNLHDHKPDECSEWQAGCALCLHYRSLPADCFWGTPVRPQEDGKR